MKDTLKRDDVLGEINYSAYTKIYKGAAKLASVFDYEYDTNYYVLISEYANSDPVVLASHCLNGEKFSLYTQPQQTVRPEPVVIPELTPEPTPDHAAKLQAFEQQLAKLSVKTEINSDINYLLSSGAAFNQPASAYGANRGAFYVSSIDSDGRVRLNYLNETRFNLKKVSAYRTRIRWSSVDGNGVPQLHQGAIGWTSSNGAYAFLIKDQKSAPYPKVNRGLVIESHR